MSSTRVQAVRETGTDQETAAADRIDPHEFPPSAAAFGPDAIGGRVDEELISIGERPGKALDPDLASEHVEPAGGESESSLADIFG